MDKIAYDNGLIRALCDLGVKTAEDMAPPGPEMGGAGGAPGGMPDDQLETILSQMSPEELAQILGALPEQELGGAMGGMQEPQLEGALGQLPPEVLQQLLAGLGGGEEDAGGPPGGEEGPEMAEEAGGSPFPPKKGKGGEKKEKSESKGKDEKKEKKGPEKAEKEAFDQGVKQAMVALGLEKVAVNLAQPLEYMGQAATGAAMHLGQHPELAKMLGAGAVGLGAGVGGTMLANHMMQPKSPMDQLKAKLKQGWNGVKRMVG